MDYHDVKNLFERISSLAYDIKRSTQRTDRITIDEIVGIIEEVYRYADQIEDLAAEKQDVLDLIDTTQEDLSNALEHIKELGAYGDDCRACSNELNCLMNK